jgi:hypothetical protein
MTSKQTSRHLGDDELDAYSRGKASEDLVERVEEHLLVCEECVRRAEKSDGYVEGVTSAAAQVRELHANRRSSPARAAWPVAAGVAIIAGGLFFHYTPAGSVPVAVVLQATRGPGGAPQAPSEREIILRPDLSGIAAFDRYRIEMVDASGAPAWQGSLAPTRPEVRIAGLRAGAYFVRLYSPGGELLREYGLHIGR